MTDIDDELRDALRRVEPPAGFAERVLQRVGEAGASTGDGRGRSPCGADPVRPHARQCSAGPRPRRWPSR